MSWIFCRETNFWLNYSSGEALSLVRIIFRPLTKIMLTNAIVFYVPQTTVENRKTNHSTQNKTIVNGGWKPHNKPNEAQPPPMKEKLPYVETDRAPSL